MLPALAAGLRSGFRISRRRTVSRLVPSRLPTRPRGFLTIVMTSTNPDAPAAVRLDGKVCGASVEELLIPRAKALNERGLVPHLAVVIVGDDPASHIYVGAKQRGCERLGIKSTKVALPADVSYETVVETVQRLNEDKSVNGILVQSPLPKGMDEIKITDLIDPLKDVDGFHAQNLGRLVQGDATGLLPCTPAGVMELLKYYDVETKGKHAVVLGRSRIVGAPQSLLLWQKGIDCTVTTAHSRTQNLEEVCRSADILVAAVGRPEMVRKEWIKPGAVIIDVGINRVEDASRAKGFRLCGDVHAETRFVASKRTPVPGGVGPMTIAMLMKNTVRATEMQNP